MSSGGDGAGAEAAPPAPHSAATEAPGAEPPPPLASPAHSDGSGPGIPGAARIIPLGQSGAGIEPSLFEEWISEDSFHDAMLAHARTCSVPLGWNEWQQLASLVKDHYEEAQAQAASGRWTPWVRSVRYSVNDEVFGEGWRTRHFEKSRFKRASAAVAALPGDGGASVSGGAAGAGGSPERYELSPRSSETPPPAAHAEQRGGFPP